MVGVEPSIDPALSWGGRACPRGGGWRPGAATNPAVQGVV
jgi:hypothetical protein